MIWECAVKDALFEAGGAKHACNRLLRVGVQEGVGNLVHTFCGHHHGHHAAARVMRKKSGGGGGGAAAAPALAHDQAQVPRFVGKDGGVGRVPDVGDALHIAAVGAAMASSAVARAAVTHAAVVIVKSHHRRRHGTRFTSNTPRSFR